MYDKVIEVLRLTLNSKEIDKAVEMISKCKPPHRIFLLGNGGSSSTASHFAGDLTSINFDTMCLTDNIARFSAIVNDFGREDVFILQLQHLQSSDLLIAISVHGGSNDWSNNLIKAAEHTKKKGAKTLSLVGHDGGQLAKICDFSIIVPSDETYIVEGIHCVLTHVICEKIKLLKLGENLKEQFVGDEKYSK